MEETPLVSRFIIQPMMGNKPVQVSPPEGTPGGPPGSGQTVVTAPQDLIAEPIWNRPIQLSLNVYISTTNLPGKVLERNAGPEVNLAHLSWDNIEWGDWNVQRNWTGDITLPSVRNSCRYRSVQFLTFYLQFVQNNESAIWAHVFMAADGTNHLPYGKGFDPSKVHHVKKRA